MEDRDYGHEIDAALMAEIVRSYVANNSLPAAALPDLIRSVYATIAGLRTGAPVAAATPTPEVERPTRAQIAKSITPDALISFIDGKPYKTLKRHLGTHGLDPHGYRHRYGLDPSYPMVAPNYSAQRSDLAKGIGLGVPGGQAARETAQAA